MFEILVLMLSVGVQAAVALDDTEPKALPQLAVIAPEPTLPTFGSDTPTEKAPVPSLPSFGEAEAPKVPTFSLDDAGDDETASEVPALPTFLAPKPADAAPAFLAPKPADAAPAFLAPAPAAPAAAAPVFLAPQAAAPAPAAPATPTAAAPQGYQAEPQIITGKFTTALEVKPILDATRNSWVALQDSDGLDRLYVSHLWGWRCGLLEIRVGLNGAVPTVWPMPPCQTDLTSPNAIPNEWLPLQTYPYNTVQVIEVQLLFDDLTMDSSTFLRKNIRF